MTLRLCALSWLPRTYKFPWFKHDGVVVSWENSPSESLTLPSEWKSGMGWPLKSSMVSHLSVIVFKEISCIFTQANRFVCYMSKHFVFVCKITFCKPFVWLQICILCLYGDQNQSVHKGTLDISAKQFSSGDLTLVPQPGTNLEGPVW